MQMNSSEDRVYVRFVRQFGLGSGQELLHRGMIPIAGLPRQGDYVHVKVSENRSIGSIVEKVIWHYENDPHSFDKPMMNLQLVEIVVM